MIAFQRKRSSKFIARPLFSKEDEELLIHRWRLDRKGYVVRTGTRVNGKPTKIFAHHEVLMRVHGRRLDVKKGELCDHINRRTTDNRRENLRIGSYQLNSMNSPKGIGGVCWEEQSKKWKATVRNKIIGFFHNRIDAWVTVAMAIGVIPTVEISPMNLEFINSKFPSRKIQKDNRRTAEGKTKIHRAKQAGGESS